MTRIRRVAAASAVALAAGAVLSGCSSVPEWAGSADAPADAASSTPLPSTATSGNRSGAPPSPSSSTSAATPSRTPTATSTPSRAPGASPSPSASPGPSATSSAKPSAKASTKAKPPPQLRYGDSGTKVTALQKRLTDLGYWLGRTDGDFGPLTQQAVFALQKAAGISRDGIVGPKTRKALDRGVRPKATLKGDGVEIDIARQLLLVVRKGKVSTVLNTSTGNGEPYTTTFGTPSIAVTPRGTFSVIRAVDGMAESSLGKLWRPRYFTGSGYAVHGSSSVPPYPASHGCVRVSNAAMNMVWAEKLMPIGSTITIH